MKIISWNVNGINSTVKKGLLKFMAEQDADIYCFQEVKVSEETIDKKLLNLQKYDKFWNQAEKRGYSGVLTYSKYKPLATIEGIGHPEYDSEGRLLTLEFNEFYLLNAYFPNAGSGLKRLDFKLGYNDAFLEYCNDLRKQKPIILTGDLNVAHKEIDLANPKSNTKNAGFTIEERNWFTKFLTEGYVDTFREFTQDGGHYTFWSYRTRARERNVGWRLDYFVVNNEFLPKVKCSEILSEVYGSDHCPILLEIQ